jgi:DNA-binding MarR family transcriptional regulator
MGSIMSSTDEATVPEGPSASPGHLLWRVTQVWQRGIRAALGPHDLTHEQFVLLAGTWWLAEHEGPPTQRRLADHSGMEPVGTCEVLRALESADLVEQMTDAAHPRVPRVQPTAAGRAVLSRAMPDVHAADARFFAPVSRSEIVRSLASLADRGESS